MKRKIKLKKKTEQSFLSMKIPTTAQNIRNKVTCTNRNFTRLFENAIKMLILQKKSYCETKPIKISRQTII